MKVIEPKNRLNIWEYGLKYVCIQLWMIILSKIPEAEGK